MTTIKSATGARTATPEAGTIPATPISLDSGTVENWRFGTKAAVLSPDADPHAVYAWLYVQADEIAELLWGYISITDNDTGEKAPAVAHALCHFIEARAVTMRRVLEALCERTQHQRQGGAA